MSRRAGPLIDTALVFAAYLLAVFHGLAPLGDDPDLGWHLAAGVWITDMLRLPITDPFGAQANPWVCYSWLPELAMGLAYRAGGFFGVKILAVAFFLLPVGAAILVAQAARARATDAPPDAVARTSVWLTVAIILAFSWTAWSLRPQSLSWVLFAVFVAEFDRERLRHALLVPLTILWANTHVFWILAPGMVGLTALRRGPWSARAAARAGALGAAYLALGMLNPYGWELFSVMWFYTFQFGTANQMIRELAPVHFGAPTFWLFAATLALMATAARRIATREHPLQVLLTALLAAQAARQVRFLPLYAIAAAPILARTAWPHLLGGFRRPTAGGAPAPDQPRRVALIVGPVLLLAAACFGWRDAPLRPRLRDLLAITQQLEDSGRFRERQQVTVFNNFNDGGWLELFFWLNRPPGWTQSRFKVAIDGRTNVVGQERMLEYDRIRRAVDDWAALCRAWGLDVVIGPRGADLLAALARGSREGAGPPGRWAVITERGGYTVMARSDHGE